MPKDPRICEYFTLVFKGDIRTFEKNPLRTETPFGTPIIAGIGNAWDEVDQLQAKLDNLSR